MKLPKELQDLQLPDGFAQVIVDAAYKNNTDFSVEFVKLAIEGAEHRRMCKK
jgi:hypothetical protein